MKGNALVIRIYARLNCPKIPVTDMYKMRRSTKILVPFGKNLFNLYGNPRNGHVKHTKITIISIKPVPLKKSKNFSDTSGLRQIALRIRLSELTHTFIAQTTESFHTLALKLTLDRTQSWQSETLPFSTN